MQKDTWSNRYIRLRERKPNIDVKIKPSPDNDFTEFEEEQTFRYRTDSDSYVRPSKVHDDPEEVIVFLGGSSTACRYVEEKERFPYKSGRLIEKETGIKINSYNAGVSGSNSLHSINSLLNKILTLDPDYTVLCHNWNDLNILLFEDDYRNDNSSRSTLGASTNNPRYHLLKWIYQLWETASPRTSKLGLALYKKLTNNKYSPDDFERHRGKEIQFNESQMISKFRGNLNTFISICEEHGTEPILMTQQNRMTEEPDQVIQDRFEWFYNVQKMEYDTYKELYDRFNNEIRSVADTNNIICIDLDEEVPSIPEYMYDVIHFKIAGSQYGSRVIKNTLKEEIA
jgi:hypothetical protein